MDRSTMIMKEISDLLVLLREEAHCLRLPCKMAPLLVLGVTLSDLEDGIELAAIGIDPFWLFEVFELSIEVSPKVNLHKFLIDAC